MHVAHPEFVPDPTLDREEMKALQYEIAEGAVFEDDLNPTTATVVGVDQAFLDDRAVSAIVAVSDGEVIERTHAITDVSIPYVPGLLSFREGESIVKAFATLATEPDLALFDGSGRIHFREAGLATHIGVTLDVPSIGVIKNLLCGRIRDPPEEPFAEGTHVPIVADGNVTAPEGTVIGYAVQTRQYEGGSRYINPLYVSPGHRVGPETAVEVVEDCVEEYKLPEPIRLADRYAETAKQAHSD